MLDPDAPPATNAPRPSANEMARLWIDLQHHGVPEGTIRELVLGETPDGDNATRIGRLAQIARTLAECGYRRGELERVLGLSRLNFDPVAIRRMVETIQAEHPPRTLDDAVFAAVLALLEVHGAWVSTPEGLATAVRAEIPGAFRPELRGSNSLTASLHRLQLRLARCGIVVIWGKWPHHARARYIAIRPANETETG